MIRRHNKEKYTDYLCDGSESSEARGVFVCMCVSAIKITKSNAQLRGGLEGKKKKNKRKKCNNDATYPLQCVHHRSNI